MTRYQNKSDFWMNERGRTRKGFELYNVSESKNALKFYPKTKTTKS